MVRSGCDSDVAPSLSGQLDDEVDWSLLDECRAAMRPLAFTNLSASCGTFAFRASALSCWQVAVGDCLVDPLVAGVDDGRRPRRRDSPCGQWRRRRSTDRRGGPATRSFGCTPILSAATFSTSPASDARGPNRPWPPEVAAPFRAWITASSWSELMVPFCTRPSSADFTAAALPPPLPSGAGLLDDVLGWGGLRAGREHGADGEGTSAEYSDDAEGSEELLHGPEDGESLLAAHERAIRVFGC